MKSAGEEFIIKTKYQNMGLSDQMKGVPPPGLQLPYSESGEIITLPAWDEITVSEDNIISGDIIISLQTVESNSQMYQTDYLEELHRVIIHGILHLCGLKDSTTEEEELMRTAENRALEIFFP